MLGVSHVFHSKYHRVKHDKRFLTSALVKSWFSVNMIWNLIDFLSRTFQVPKIKLDHLKLQYLKIRFSVYCTKYKHYRLQIRLFTPFPIKYSQSEYRKAVVHPTFPPCAACFLWAAVFSIDALHKWRLNLSNNTHTSLASHSCENSFVYGWYQKHRWYASDSINILCHAFE